MTHASELPARHPRSEAEPRPAQEKSSDTSKSDYGLLRRHSNLSSRRRALLLRPLRLPLLLQRLLGRLLLRALFRVLVLARHAVTSGFGTATLPAVAADVQWLAS